MPLIESLSPEQEALLSDYRQKWQPLILSTERMDRQRAEGALRAAYTLAGNTDPEFRFLNGPRELQEWMEQYSALDFIRQYGPPISLCDKHLITRLKNQFTPEVWKHLLTQPKLEVLELQYQLYSITSHPLSGLMGRAIGQAHAEGQAQHREKLRQQFAGEFLVQLGDYIQQITQASLQALDTSVWQPLSDQSFMQPLVQEWEKWKQIGQELVRLFSDMLLNWYFNTADFCACIDFCSSLLQFSEADVQAWLTFRSVIRSCGFVAPFKSLCFVIERPTKILLDAEGKLHADREPAVTFADGSEFYAEHLSTGQKLAKCE